jgi:hypothetical protein
MLEYRSKQRVPIPVPSNGPIDLTQDSKAMNLEAMHSEDIDPDITVIMNNSESVVQISESEYSAAEADLEASLAKVFTSKEPLVMGYFKTKCIQKDNSL